MVIIKGFGSEESGSLGEVISLMHVYIDGDLLLKAVVRVLNQTKVRAVMYVYPVSILPNVIISSNVFVLPCLDGYHRCT